MAILDIFKKREKLEKKKVKKKEEQIKKESLSEVSSPEIKKQESKKQDIFKYAYRILKPHHITEKATNLIKKNQYVFKVWPRSNKIEVRKAIEKVYGVDVLSINIINVPSRKKRLGKISGWEKGYKKAIVKIKEGKNIEVLPR